MADRYALPMRLTRRPVRLAAKLVGRHLGFVGRDLRGADLEGHDLRGASFRGADLRGARLCGADLRGCDFGGAQLDGVRARSANFSGVDFRQASIRAADFSDATLDGIIAECVDFCDVNLIGASAVGADFAEAALIGVDFSNAILDRGLFFGSNVERCIADGVSMREVRAWGTRMHANSFVGADFTGADFVRIGFDASRMMNACFVGTRVIESSFVGADLSFTDVHAMVLQRSPSLATATIVGMRGRSSVFEPEGEQSLPDSQIDRRLRLRLATSAARSADAPVRQL